MDKVKPARESVAEKIRNALASENIPHLYANGFTNALSNADIVIVLERQSDPVAVLNLSFTTAKSLAHKLSQLIENLEKASNQSIMTTDLVESALSQTMEGGS